MILLPDIDRIRRPCVAPLSYQQQQRFDAEGRSTVGLKVEGVPGVVANTYVGFRMRGDVSVGDIQRALDTIVRRHESLRTRFITVDGARMQAPVDEGAAPLDIVDGDSTEGRVAAFDAAARTALLRPFDSSRDVLVRACASRGDTDAIAVVVVPHIVSDALSLHVLADEFTALVEHARPDPLAELDVQYADFAAWQRASLGGPWRDVIRQYYRTTLAGIPPLQLPVDDCAEDESERYAADVHPFECSPRVAALVRALGTRQRVSAFMILLAAYALTASRLTGQERGIVVALCAGRPHPKLLPLIGYFANLCPIRLDVNPEWSVAELLAATRAAVLRAFDYQSVPYGALEEVAREAGGDLPPWRMSINAAFAVDASRSSGCASRVAWSPYAIDLETPVFQRRMRGHVALRVQHAAADRLAGTFMFRRALFHRATIARFVERFRGGLETMAARPDVRLKDVA